VSLEHAVLLELQCPVPRHAILSKHEAWSFVQCPGWRGHSAGSDPATWQTLPIRLQWPALVHGILSMHDTAVSMLQCPGRVGQSPLPPQVKEGLVLQVPKDGQVLAF